MICSKRLHNLPVPVRRLVELARTPSLFVVGVVKSEEPSGDANVRRHVLLGGDVAEVVRFEKRLPLLRALELRDMCIGSQKMATGGG